MKLFTYLRSQAAYRVRIALRLKRLTMEKISLDLLKGDQFAGDYQALNPEGVVPTLIDGEARPLMQSLAILEYLDEKYPQPPLLPNDLHARAHARAIAQMGAPLARYREPRRRAGAGARSAHRTVLRRRSGHRCGHLSRRTPDQR